MPLTGNNFVSYLCKSKVVFDFDIKSLISFFNLLRLFS